MPFEKPSSCAYFVSHKKRFCRMLVSKGNKFCGQHLTNQAQSEDDCKKRIPCPLDPKHTCYACRLDHHIASCNARKKIDVPFFSLGINEGEGIDPPHSELKSLCDASLITYISRIQEIHKDYVGCIQERVSSHPALDEMIEKSSLCAELNRHLKQVSSLMAFLESENLLGLEDSKMFIEFGAGRGRLSSCLFEAVDDKENSSFLLIDRGSQRNKFDSKLKHSGMAKVERLRIDIQDLDLNKVDCIQKDSIIIACGKHLCGAATDFSLRCLAECKKGRIGGIVFSMCCHHRSSWKSYTGKEFIKQVGFQSEDFRVLQSLTSWAVSGSKIASKTNSHLPIADNHKDVEDFKNEDGVAVNRYQRMGLTSEFREEIGRKAKQIIDMGRVSFLKQLGFDAALIQYSHRSQTLENIALVASHK